MRTGMSPGTVSMCPSRTIVRGGVGGADLADGVAGFVHEGAVVAGVAHALDEPAAPPRLRDRDSDGMATRPRTRSTAAARSITRLCLANRVARSRATPRSISSSVITSGGSRRRIVGPAGSAITPCSSISDLEHRRHLGAQFDGQHQSEPADVAHHRHAVERRAQGVPASARPAVALRSMRPSSR